MLPQEPRESKEIGRLAQSTAVLVPQVEEVERQLCGLTGVGERIASAQAEQARVCFLVLPKMTGQVERLTFGSPEPEGRKHEQNAHPTQGLGGHGFEEDIVGAIVGLKNGE
jgi:hypothetical protein